MNLTGAILKQLAPALPLDVANNYASIYNAVCPSYGIDTADDYITTAKDTTLSGVKITTTGPGTVKLNPDGSIEATGNIRNARYNETGKTKKQDSSTTKTSTDTQLQVTDQKKGMLSVPSYTLCSFPFDRCKRS